ncbi:MULTISPECIES: nucleoside-diphosphate kinase [unclassified Enterococcus]|uniref:nucleoside-diphosphate kinase n=1 Tax=unclassified Enterococcus TaxID=2608891 RepID=UPI0015533224|nr:MULTISPECIES: nucleoside-diphosphate kinase [unclassified Enterococcus]MBS7577888.1 nucleoside-diphosphate kinase [Enterococcus sp. MMGLQ5-2]MBS7585251.1 nucleoside-diphosphate kinase [Enterococcus sp. MMGLQ5-1]NPD13108.1 nucleoside-diphosphate kinase [Enterococcus sp. MMGLQ5-1]NPD37718.1 nucleoside-diphosphate kinase [Enterococcus sp. MMGLQ5-2]
MAEQTLILIKPDGVNRGLIGKVISRIEQKGYQIINLKTALADETTLKAHYNALCDQPYFPGIVEYMMEGPMVAIIAEGTEVVKGFRAISGPTNPTMAPPGTIRGDFGRSWHTGAIRNIVHGSDSPENAQREIKLWFPELVSQYV